MTRKRRSLSASFKAQVALAAARRDKSLAELASQHGVYPNQISAWKKQLLEGVQELFEDGRKRTPVDELAEASRLDESRPFAVKGRGPATVHAADECTTAATPGGHSAVHWSR